MKFGVSTFLTDQGIAPAALGRAVEERGLDSLLIAEHTHIPVDRRSPYPGGGEAAFDRVAALGDAWLANSLPPQELGPKIDRLRSIAGRDVPVTVYAVANEPEIIEQYTQLDVERLLFYLPTLPEPETLSHLDRFSDTAARFR
ncbi:hypothetical protein [Streptomyces platensis]|uniref:hypothetical protein n=1 Tax=Streptomyces platensis TaxID=58346 RepID=UPI00386ADD58|nr:hypothetical protein OG962_00535 [Streptomyces platensis]